MIRGRNLFLSVLALGLPALLFLSTSFAVASPEITVGEFATMVASQMQAAPGDKSPATPEAAARILDKAGVRFKSDLSSPLTAGDAADIFQQLGITLQAEHPEKPLARDRASALVATFGDTLKARGAGTPAASPTLPSTRSAAGTPSPTLEDLLACQNLPKVKDCHDCCRALGVISSKTCGQACSNSPKASAMEPTP